MKMNRAFACGIVFVLCLFTVLPVRAKQCASWPQWEVFRNTFMTEDGRIIDLNSSKPVTTSEGQAYGMFFALVAGDQKSFTLLLNWTTNNLADGNLSQRLPAWLWGRDGEGQWHVLDDNSASDVDLWLAYSLLEAGRLWNRVDYEKLGLRLSELIFQKEVVEIPGLGATLLPAPYGFHPQPDIWRLNPSYSPIQLLRYLATKDKKWRGVIGSSMKMLKDTAPRGFSPDWVEYRIGQGFGADRTGKNIGSYDAIRVYLWAGMLHGDDPERTALLQRLAPMSKSVEQHGVPPEKMNTRTGEMEGAGPIGFTAALLPFLTSSGNQTALVSQLSRLLEHPLSEEAESYYNQVLGLFGLGWYQNRYGFLANGQLQLSVNCP